MGRRKETLTYRQVGHIRENGYEGVYFEDDEGNTLGIERADSFDDDDVQNGLDTYCITLGTGQTVYGGIDRWEVDEPGHAWLLITPEAAAVLGTPDVQDPCALTGGPGAGALRLRPRGGCSGSASPTPPAPRRGAA